MLILADQYDRPFFFYYGPGGCRGLHEIYLCPGVGGVMPVTIVAILIDRGIAAIIMCSIGSSNGILRFFACSISHHLHKKNKNSGQKN